jgi:hypothetical protein
MKTSGEQEMAMVPRELVELAGDECQALAAWHEAAHAVAALASKVPVKSVSMTPANDGWGNWNGNAIKGIKPGEDGFDFQVYTMIAVAGPVAAWEGRSVSGYIEACGPEAIKHAFDAYRCAVLAIAHRQKRGEIPLRVIVAEVRAAETQAKKILKRHRRAHMAIALALVKSKSGQLTDLTVKRLWETTRAGTWNHEAPVGADTAILSRTVGPRDSAKI